MGEAVELRRVGGWSARDASQILIFSSLFLQRRTSSMESCT